MVPHSPRPTLFDHLRELGRELAHALRTAAKRPTFSLVAIATLGIGIGASTATFSIADAVLMRPLPVHEQRKLSVLWGVDQAAGAAQVPVPYPAFKGFVDGSPRTLSAIAGVDYHGADTLPVREGADGVNLKVALVTGNLSAYSASRLCLAVTSRRRTIASPLRQWSRSVTSCGSVAMGGIRRCWVACSPFEGSPARSSR